jgi:hypothetical protein
MIIYDTNTHSQKTIGRVSVASLLTAILVMASLYSIVIVQNNSASASNVIFKSSLKGNEAIAEKTIREGSTTTFVSAHAFTTSQGETVLCVFVLKQEDSAFVNDFEACAPGQQLTVSGDLSSATFSGTVTGLDFATGEEKTVTVNAHLTATAKVQKITSGSHFNGEDFTAISHFKAMSRSASGSLNIGGDITFSIDDATGLIAKVSSGSIEVRKN